MPTPSSDPLAYEGRAQASLRQTKRKIDRESTVSPFTMSVSGANLMILL